MVLTGYSARMISPSRPWDLMVLYIPLPLDLIYIRIYLDTLAVWLVVQGTLLEAKTLSGWFDSIKERKKRNEKYLQKRRRRRDGNNRAWSQTISHLWLCRLGTSETLPVDATEKMKIKRNNLVPISFLDCHTELVGEFVSLFFLSTCRPGFNWTCALWRKEVRPRIDRVQPSRFISKAHSHVWQFPIGKETVFFFFFLTETAYKIFIFLLWPLFPQRLFRQNGCCAFM